VKTKGCKYDYTVQSGHTKGHQPVAANLIKMLHVFKLRLRELLEKKGGETFHAG
jgi:hypothetical protein